MRVNNDIRKTVAFIGVGHGDDFNAFGTGFFLTYKKLIYIVSARHVIEPLGDDPFTIRVNDQNGGPHDVRYDPIKHKDTAPWHVHADDTVDLAVVTGGVQRSNGADFLSLPDTMLLTSEQFSQMDVGVGDECHVIGLFRLLRGKRRNLPIVHTGHIAMIPDGGERIPVANWREGPGARKTTEFEGYLVEMTSLEGLSGSPVFVRPTISFDNFTFDHGAESPGAFPFKKMYLLGMWRSAWGADAAEALQADIGDHKVPVGVGAVEPTTKLIELLEQPEVVAERDAAVAKAAIRRGGASD